MGSVLKCGRSPEQEGVEGREREEREMGKAGLEPMIFS